VAEPHLDDERIVSRALARGLLTPEQVAAARAGGSGTGLGQLVAKGALRANDVVALAREVEASRPQTLGPWRIERELGRGNFGAVYEATREGWPLPVALKVLLSDTPDAETVARFKLEAEIGAKLEHPGIVRTLDVDVAGGRLVFALELVLGQSLAGRLKTGGPLPAPEACALVARLCRATAHAHARGVLHRDLKPANVLLDARTGWPRITDFGLARDRSLLRSLTRSGDMLGSPVYMSPEALEGRRDLDARADVYALGVILHECLAGHVPYLAQDLPSLSALVQAGRLAPLRGKVPGVDAGLDRLLAKALARDRAERFPTAEAMAAALEAREARPARDESTPDAVRPRRARRGSSRAIAGAVALVGLAGLGGLVVMLRRDAPDPKVAPAVVPAATTTSASPAPPPPPPDVPGAIAAVEGTLTAWRTLDGAWVRHRLPGWADALEGRAAVLATASPADEAAAAARALVGLVTELARAFRVGPDGPRAQALSALDEAGALLPKLDPRWRDLAALEVARLEFDRGRFARAREVTNAAIDPSALDRPALELQYVAALISLWDGSDEQFGPAALELSRRDPDGVVGRKARASVVRMRDSVKGAELARAALELDDADVDATTTLIYALAPKEPAKAVPLAESVVARVPDHARAWYALARALHNAGRDDEAVLPCVRMVRILGVDYPQNDIKQFVGSVFALMPMEALTRLDELTLGLPGPERSWLREAAASRRPR
jgi:tetratricopeptide (TPR) repeat protein